MAMVKRARFQPCKVCGDPRQVSLGSAAEIVCHKCRRKQKAEDDAHRGEWPNVANYQRQKKTTTEQGLGTKHQKAVLELKRNHIDGSPCDWCGRPMWRNPMRNYDYNPAQQGSGALHGDHGWMSRSQAVKLGLPTPSPDRLLHGRCNIQRGDGTNDHLAWSRHQTSYVPMELVWLDAT